MKSAKLSKLDSKLKKALVFCAKSPLSSSDYDKAKRAVLTVAEELKPHALDEVVRTIARFFLTQHRNKELGVVPVFPVGEFLQCGAKGLNLSLAFGVQKGLAFFAAQPADALLPQVGSPTLLTKLSKKRPVLLQEALEFVRERMRSGQSLPYGTRWVIEKAKLPDLLPLVQGMLQGPYVDLAVILLGRDKTGKLLGPVIGAVEEGQVSANDVADLLVSNPKAAQAFLSLLPKILPKSQGEAALVIFKAFLHHLAKVPAQNRAQLSGALATFCGSLLSKNKLKQTETEAVECVGCQTRELARHDAGGSSGLWAIYPITSEPETAVSGLKVSRDAAELLVESIEKLEDPRYAPIEVFKSLAVNLGIEPFHSVGEYVIFDFTCHKDTGGGLVTGVSARVVQPGWKHLGLIIRKASVKPI